MVDVQALATVLLAALLGIATWTFAEYALHGWYGHLARGRNDFSREHLRHHARYMYFAPAHKKAVAAIAVAVVLEPLSVPAAGWLHGTAYAGAFVGFYLTYEFLHRRAHTHPPRGRYGRWLRRHHLYHHFSDARCNHGVTTPFWDLVFGTYSAPTAPIRVPPRLALPWMTDDSGALWDELRSDYVLGGRS